MQENVTLRDSPENVTVWNRPENVTTECSLLVSPPLSMLVYAKGLLGENGGPCVMTELDSRLRGNDE
jgi:hypothetical protein